MLRDPLKTKWLCQYHHLKLKPRHQLFTFPQQHHRLQLPIHQVQVHQVHVYHYTYAGVYTEHVQSSCMFAVCVHRIFCFRVLHTCTCTYTIDVHQQYKSPTAEFLSSQEGPPPQPYRVSIYKLTNVLYMYIPYTLSINIYNSPVHLKFSYMYMCEPTVQKGKQTIEIHVYCREYTVYNCIFLLYDCL